MKLQLGLEREPQGPSEELEELCEPLLEKVIPRLLRPLETGGRHIEPCLVHGDMWYGNVSSETDTGEPIVFDATAVYAHNEYGSPMFLRHFNLSLLLLQMN